MTYSMDLRERVVAALEEPDCSLAQVGRRFGVTAPTVRDWRDRARRGELEPGRPGPTGPMKLTEADDRILREHVAARPGITAKELIPMLGVTVIESTVCRRLIKLGLRVKKRR